MELKSCIFFNDIFRVVRKDGKHPPATLNRDSIGFIQHFHSGMIQDSCDKQQEIKYFTNPFLLATTL